jgi:hypothetical protein
VRPGQRLHHLGLLAVAGHRPVVGAVGAHDFGQHVRVARIALRSGGSVPLPGASVAATPTSADIATLPAMSASAVTVKLRQRVLDADVGVEDSQFAKLNANQIAALAAQRGVITEQSAEAVRALTVLRNLVAHGRATTLGPAEAADFLRSSTRCCTRCASRDAPDTELSVRHDAEHVSCARRRASGRVHQRSHTMDA